MKTVDNEKKCTVTKNITACKDEADMIIVFSRHCLDGITEVAFKPHKNICELCYEVVYL